MAEPKDKPIHTGKYAKYVSPILRRPGHLLPDGTYDAEFRQYDEYVARPPLTFDRRSYPESTVWVEVLHTYAPGSGWGFPTPDFPEQKGHYHEDIEETFVFIGTNTDDLDDLGGEVEFWMGEGEEAEKIVIDRAASIVCPVGVVHSPCVYRKVNDPAKPIITIVVANQGEYRNEMRLPGALPSSSEVPKLKNQYFDGDKWIKK